MLIGVALVALGVPTAAQADTRSCPPNFSGFPGASKIRVINAYCATYGFPRQSRRGHGPPRNLR